jgi:TonB family protein
MLRHFRSVRHMSILFSDARFNTRARRGSRSSTGLWLSVVVHATFAVIMTAVVPTRASEKTSTSRPRSIAVFRMPSTEAVAALPPRIEAPRLPAPVRPRPVRQVAIADVPKPVAVAPIVAKHVEPAPAALLPSAAPVFERPVETKAPERPPEVGLFERANGARTSQSAVAVTTGAFGKAASSTTSQAAAAVTTGGFGSVASSARSSTNDASDVRTAGFDRRASAPVQSPAPAATPIDRPVEIVFKPSPEYTDDARSARIEGTVTLDLEFTAAGDVRVLRIVRGLGHGLDEAAERAALRIRFKPAQADGRAVDSRATVHITFRLS